MRLTKEELLRRLEGLSEDISDMQRMVVAVTEQTRAVDAVETDAWCSIEFAQERLGQLAERVDRLVLDVRSDL